MYIYEVFLSYRRGVIVTLFTANQQSLEGVKDVMQRARRGHQ